MEAFYVNGALVTSEKEQSLLAYLRDELGLTGAKNGCAQGACGTCMVLVDGKAVKACVQKTRNLGGKSVVTIEGLTETEKQAYSFAFAKAGAVQCGFCIPGMVISAKGLIDACPAPTEEQVREAIRNNICRCTGYQKIVDAILLAASILRGDTVIAPACAEEVYGVGALLPRVDAVDKTLGTALYADDLSFPNMLYGAAVRSKYPRARVLSVDVSAAKAAQGVAAVITAKDLKGEKIIGHLKHDQYVLVEEGRQTSFLGDAVAIVAAETREQAKAAAALVQVEYEELSGYFTIEASENALEQVIERQDNLLFEQRLVRGNADEKIAQSKYVVTKTYRTPPTEHAFMEPETAVAVPEVDGGVRIYSGDQGVYQTKHECALATGLPEEMVRVSAMMVGGGFGGKEDISVQHFAAILALETKRPVKFSLTRDESILVHPKRHAMEMTFTTACDEQGCLTAMKAVIKSDTGAYASLGGPVLQRACTHAAGPYNYQDVEIIGRAYYTNNPPAGAFRGFGVTQSCFATEMNLNLLAEMAGISPWEIRYRNAIRPGQVLPNGQIANETTALAETLEAVRPYFERNPKAGIACGMKNSGLGVGVPDVGRCTLRVQEGKIHIYSSAAGIGQGVGTVLTQMVGEVTKLPRELIVYESPDTATCPDAGNTTASRQSVLTGEATRRAAELLMKDLEGEDTIAALNGKEYLGEYAPQTDPISSTKSNPVSHIAYGYATQMVELEEDGKLKRVIAAHDVGKAINLSALEGQIEGGVVMSLGYALTEDFPLEEGRPKAKLGTLGLFKAPMVPPVETIIVGKPAPEPACGVKGVGEICSVPTAPAVALAYYQRDGQFRTSLPLENTPYSRKK